ncbi:uncharacterized protein LOC110854692 [Folsomia candida]|nr:uncharacterized protein LOC110854692 [Folsomia candida]
MSGATDKKLDLPQQFIQISTNGNKTDTVKLQNNEQPTSNTNPIPDRKNGKNKNSRSVIRKTVANFKCTGEKCGKTWSSMHAWRKGSFYCEICYSKAKVSSFVDEHCTLSVFSCEDCNELWRSLDPVQEDECVCGRLVVATQQELFGRHYYCRCLNENECGVEWEDFDQEEVYSQRCRQCHSAGVMYSMSKINHKRNGARRVQFMGFGGSHDIEGCDMCQILIDHGVAKTCMRKLRLFLVLRTG